MAVSTLFLPSFPLNAFGPEWVNEAMLSIINKSDLIIDRGFGLVSVKAASTLGEFRWMRCRCRLAGIGMVPLGG
ncbi:hypothetical protein, partial [Mesorhizobium sp. M7A.F.Ca.CA.001.12.2.1]|uniref:hypothetical protein n=1 Tax=Mesorhizobium sp. M7A.F.Ca.CA.001.12.2.1 TaxID=2496725 RepID=UPI0019D2188C